MRAWEYQVLPQCVEGFVAAYEHDGAWALLFARAAGYIGTSLYRSTVDVTTFMTVDRWTSAADWDAYLGVVGDDYTELDLELEHMTAWEHRLFEGCTD